MFLKNQTMKYYFCETPTEDYIIVAENIEKARSYVLNEEYARRIKNLYELLPDTFDQEGTLMARKKSFAKS